MMANMVTFIVVILVGLAIKSYSPVGMFNNAAYALGILLLVGYIAGKLVKKLRFPSITGSILAGILVGPYGLALISLKNTDDLQLLNGLALSIIALTAGGEINFSRLKKNLKAINAILIFQSVIMISGIMIFIVLIKPWIPFLKPLDLNVAIASGLLLGIIATASSPSTTLAVIVESGVRNRLTEITLSIVMLKDIIILFLFCIGLNISMGLVGGSEQGQATIMATFLQISGSLGSGVVIGFIIVLYLKFVNKDTIVFILALSFFTYEILEPLHLHPLLVMMVAGFVVENFSKEGDNLMKHLESLSPPVYVVFFTLTGATINLNYLRELWLLAILISFTRIIFKHLGSWTGAFLAKEPAAVRKRIWMPFISQAGLSLGMAKIIEESFAGLGTNLAVLIISVIVINQIVGPLLLKIFLDQSVRLTNK